MNAWNNAINSEFIETLIDDIQNIKSEYDDSGREKEYYEEIGRLVCASIQNTYDKDVEI